MIEPVERLIRPRSVAIVGASAERRSISSVVLENLRSFAYAGELNLVSRSKDEIDGISCVRGIGDLPPGVDVAVLCIPQAAVAGALRECAQRGIAAAIVFASGYAEAGDDGRAAQAELTRLARELPIAVVGPNCMGIANLRDGIPLSFTEFAPNPSDSGKAVAVIAQSGAMMGSITIALQTMGCAVSYAFSTGNEANLTVEDFLAFCIRDDVTRVMCIFAEQLRQPQRFRSLALEARAAGKDIVLLHPGRSERAKESAASHTGAIAGEYATMEAVLRESGVLLVASFEELYDVANIASRSPSVELDGGVAIVTNSGAFGGFALDFCDAIGLPVAMTGSETQAHLRTFLPSYVGVTHFVDLGTAGRGSPTIYGDAARALIDDPAVSSVVMVMVGGSPASQLVKANSILPRVANVKKRAVLAILGDAAPLDETFLGMVGESGLPFFRSPERAFRALGTLHRRDHVRALQRKDASVPGSAPANFPARMPAGPIDEFTAKQFLATCGIATPRGARVLTRAEGHAAATSIGYPVVLKANVASIVHKSDAGVVIANVGDANAFDEAWNRISRALADRGYPEPQPMLVEQHITHDLELVVGARRSAEWGTVTLVGLGGIWIEILDDVRIIPSGSGRARIADELAQLRSFALLRGARGSAAVDIDALVATIETAGAIMERYDDIVELDVNPLVPAGAGFTALDVLIVTVPAGESSLRLAF